MKKIMRLKTVEKQVANGRIKVVGQLQVGEVEMLDLKTNKTKTVTVKSNGKTQNKIEE